jgi:hypothetical protein
MNDSTCQYCGKKFLKPSTMFTHVCEQKRRHLQKDEKSVRIGFDAFNRFFKLNQNLKGDKTYEEFSKSPYYNSFVKFGSYVNNVDPLYPDSYINWVIKSGVKLDHWAKDSLYEKYVLELIHTEPVDVALDRTINHMLTWAKNNDSQWNHYFNYVNVNRSTFDIKDGKISPWLLLNCASGKRLLSKMDDIQLESVSNIINPVVWVKKFQNQTEDLNIVKMVVKQAKL